MKKRVFIEIISNLMILLFVYTGLIKILHRETFEIQISKSPYLTDYSIPVSWAIPILELVAVALLIFQKTRILGLYLSFALMTLFTEYIGAMLKYSDYLPCSCGGIIAKMNWTAHLFFNLFFMLSLIFAIRWEAAFDPKLIAKKKEKPKFSYNS